MEMPSRSTLTELVNAVSNETRLLVLDAELAQVLFVKFDDFKTILQDSTHVGGNTAWPTDSRLMVGLITRLLHTGTRLDRVGLPVFQSPDEVEALLNKMVMLNREIDFSKGKKGAARKRKRHYQRLLKMSAQVDGLVKAQLAPLADALFALDVQPSQKERATRALERLRVDLAALGKVREACEARVIRNEKVPMSEKVLSVSDPDAGFISKGQRDPVIGYKPQIARSGGGFIVGLSLPKGNAADSKQLIPMLEDVMSRTQVIPNVVSVDDGYASSDNKKALEKLGIDVISINGAKGKALTSDVDWKSDEYAEARGKRSAVESVMFTLKEGFDFGEVARRGLEAVYAEQLERVLAFNLCHLVRRLRAVAKAAAEGKAAA
jgi:IS5 family transposase